MPVTLQGGGVSGLSHPADVKTVTPAAKPIAAPETSASARAKRTCLERTMVEQRSSRERDWSATAITPTKLEAVAAPGAAHHRHFHQPAGHYPRTHLRGRKAPIEVLRPGRSFPSAAALGSYLGMVWSYSRYRSRYKRVSLGCRSP